MLSGEIALKNNHYYYYIKEKKRVKLINHDCLPISLLLYTMLAYLMPFDASSNTVCLYNAFFLLFLPLIFQMLFVFMLCHGSLTQFVYFKCYIASCTILLICFLLV